MSLKEIYEALADVPAYAGLCERLGLSPCDGEHLAHMEISGKPWAKALEWVEKGMVLKSDPQLAQRGRVWTGAVKAGDPPPLGPEGRCASIGLG